MQTHPVHGLIFSLPPGSPELLVPSTIIQVIDLNFKSPLHFQFQQKIKITQRKNLAIINSAAMNIGVHVSLQGEFFPVSWTWCQGHDAQMSLCVSSILQI